MWFQAVTIKCSFSCYYMEVTVVFFQEGCLAPCVLSITLTLILEDKGLLVIWSLSGRIPEEDNKPYKVRATVKSSADWIISMKLSDAQAACASLTPILQMRKLRLQEVISPA